MGAEGVGVDTDCMTYLAAHVVEALAEDSRSCILGVQVEIVATKLYLIGQVETEERRRAAEVVARELVPPGMQVINQLWVPKYDRLPVPEPVP
jgi:hypothetical protein